MRQGVVNSLVRTILSQNTTAANADRAYRHLKDSFPHWQQVARAPERAVVEAIRPAGLASQRAKVIQCVLTRLEAEDASLQCEYLQCKPTAAVLEYLEAFPGVGPKTAACVVLFELGRAVFPVDTHLLRISKRLGWVAPEVSAPQAQRFLEPLVPEGLRYELHVNLIAHGRTTCRAQRPKCTECVLARLCRRQGCTA